MLNMFKIFLIFYICILIRFIYCLFARAKVEDIIYWHVSKMVDNGELPDYRKYFAHLYKPFLSAVFNDTFILTKWRLRDFCDDKEIRKEVFGSKK